MYLVTRKTNLLGPFGPCSSPHNLLGCRVLPEEHQGSNATHLRLQNKCREPSKGHLTNHYLLAYQHCRRNSSPMKPCLPPMVVICPQCKGVQALGNKLCHPLTLVSTQPAPVAKGHQPEPSKEQPYKKVDGSYTNIRLYDQYLRKHRLWR